MPRKYGSTIFPRIKDLREDIDITQEKIAKDLNLHRTQYRRYENGENTPLDFAVEIAKYYNVSLDYLAGLTDKPKPLYPGSESKVVNIKNAGHNNKFNIKQ